MNLAIIWIEYIYLVSYSLKVIKFVEETTDYSQYFVYHIIIFLFSENLDRLCLVNFKWNRYWKMRPRQPVAATCPETELAHFSSSIALSFDRLVASSLPTEKWISKNQDLTLQITNPRNENFQ